MCRPDSAKTAGQARVFLRRFFIGVLSRHSFSPPHPDKLRKAREPGVSIECYTKGNRLCEWFTMMKPPTCWRVFSSW